jgi:hypothetical protein
LTAGTHTIIVRGIDAAGNTTSKTITFVVHATLKGLWNAVVDGWAKGYITGAEAMTLVNILNSAMNGNSAKKFPPFISEVQNQSGKSIAPGYAALLLNWAYDLLPRL